MKTPQKQNHIYSIISIVALVLVGGILGYIVNGVTRPNNSGMNEQQCMQLSNRISNALSYGRYDELERLNKIFAESCSDINIEVPERKAEETAKLPSVTCEAVETLLLKRLDDSDEDDINSETHIERAKIYANLSERGCAKNTNVYKDLAKKEIDIARALNDDNLNNEYETTEIVETYKRLQLQAEAEKMLEKAKKLTNPAIDFIIQLEKIIEE